MASKRIRWMGAFLCCTLLAQPAWAWGPQARQAIVMAALQVVRLTHDYAFTAEESNYEADLLHGAEAGVDIIRGSTPLANEEQTISAIAHEIQLLREAKRKGAGSYFAYRMGVLGALVSEVVLPFGVAFSDEDAHIKEQIDGDIDRNFERYVFTPKRTNLVFMRSPQEYFRERRTFYVSDHKLIADDYARGARYRGFLSEGGEAYFARAVEAVGDAWYTVFTQHAFPGDGELSPRILAWFLVDKIGYLISTKNNLVHANLTYATFDALGVNIVETYEVIGDYYYAHEAESSRERGVAEWKIARRRPGPHRIRVAKKLAEHYLEQGKKLFEKAQGPLAEAKDLKDALRAFQSALEFERTNDIAADHITETTAAITARQEAFDTQQSIIDKALTVIQQAERAHVGQAYESALMTYSQALMLLGAVDTQFDELYSKGRKETGRVTQSIRDVINDVFGAANDVIEEGDRSVDRRQFDRGIDSYNGVKDLLAVIPQEGNSAYMDRKSKLVELAATRVADAEAKKRRFEQEQSQAPGGAPGGRPGGPPGGNR